MSGCIGWWVAVEYLDCWLSSSFVGGQISLTNDWLVRWLDIFMTGWLDGQLAAWVNDQIDGWIYGWLDGWLVGWMDGWMGY